MPSSTWHNIETFVEIVCQLKPNSFLDIGVGNGKWGFLFREYTDVWSGHFLRTQWTSTVHGVEIYEPYISQNGHQREIYDKIFIGDATCVINELGSYDIIYAGDVLEHIEKEASVTLLGKLIGKAKVAMICSVPLGAGWLSKGRWENQYEDHVSAWELADLRNLGFSLYNVTPDPANAKRRVGFFVHTRLNLRSPRLKQLGRSWFN